MKKYSRKATLITVTAAVMSFSMLCLTGCGNKNNEPQETGDAVTESPAAPNTPLASVYENPDWSYGQVAISGGGFVTGIINTCEPGLFYARTDVGGAYRWDKDKDMWISLSYSVSDDDKGLLGIDGIAVDPNDAASVYMIAGTEYFSGGKTCVFVSHDYGEHFDVVDVTDMIKVHGNGMGRGNGERIAVDPNNSDIIYCGGRTGGMIRSTDSGKTWQKVESFSITSTSNSNGINIILFDGNKNEGGKTTRIYAGVSRNKDDNIFISEDGGESWNVFETSSEAAQKLMPQRFDLDSKGNLYVSYGNNEGPWNSAKGTLYKYNADSKTSEEISVVAWTVGDIVIDPANDNNMLLVTSQVWKEQPNGAFGDKFFRSTDGGATWEDLDGKYTMSLNNIPWIEGAAIHWCSSLAIDSSDSNRVMVNSGNGIFACDNIWSDAPEFYFESRGIEETVPEDIITYKDYPLVSAVGDFDGYVHEDIFTPAVRHTKQIGSTTSITIAADNHDIWAKVGGDESNQLLCYSVDGGKTWSDITNSPESGKVFYKGKVALTADGKTLLWSPSNSYYVYRTENWGESWEQVEGIIGSQNVYLIGDNVDSNTVYACANSVFYVSTDGGKKFSRKYDTMTNYKRMAVSPDEEGRVYIPGGGAGLLTTADKGENMALVPGLKYCEAVGLGKPKNEGDPYVIYVYGTAADSDSKGIYMTENNGESWMRVNDDLHTFGGTGNGEFISGDMNVYGRCYMSTVGMGIVYCDKNEK
ncbi:MAG: hypothetical protein K2K57_08855 [Oscillospiraceae bacterium]|nr:hypothetical protein [Oscillospiraceae bacterium]